MGKLLYNVHGCVSQMQMVWAGRKMNIGFTGTRQGMTQAQWHWTKREILALKLDYENTFHHGCCVGADEQAHRIVRDHIAKMGVWNWGIVLHPPQYTKHKALCLGEVAQWRPKPYLDRNRDIVNCSDILIAAPAGPEVRRSGTWSTVRYARKCGKPIIIIYPDGRVEHENQKKD